MFSLTATAILNLWIVGALSFIQQQLHRRWPLFRPTFHFNTLSDLCLCTWHKCKYGAQNIAVNDLCEHLPLRVGNTDSKPQTSLQGLITWFVRVRRQRVSQKNLELTVSNWSPFLSCSTFYWKFAIFSFTISEKAVVNINHYNQRNPFVTVPNSVRLYLLPASMAIDFSTDTVRAIIYKWLTVLFAFCVRI